MPNWAMERCIVVVLSSLWNDFWLIVTGFSPQNCHQHLSSEMNQARKNLQRNITRILEPWLVSGDTLSAERRAPARVSKKTRKSRLGGHPKPCWLGVLCVFWKMFTFGGWEFFTEMFQTDLEVKTMLEEHQASMPAPQVQHFAECFNRNATAG